MRHKLLPAFALLTLGAIALSQPVRAQFAVIDVAAVAQLVEQLLMLEEQLTTMREHLEQARQEYEAITGERGFEHLLEDTVRNYLPPDWEELAAAIEGVQGAYGGLADAIQTRIEENAILTEEQIALLNEAEQRELIAGRRSAAALQALSREALAATSGRFEAIQSLIDAIPTATDQKGILDLQARIGAEQTMLTNEATKLQVLFQTQQAEEWARHQRQREQAIADIGSLRDLPEVSLGQNTPVAP